MTIWATERQLPFCLSVRRLKKNYFVVRSNCFDLAVSRMDGQTLMERIEKDVEYRTDGMAAADAPIFLLFVRRVMGRYIVGIVFDRQERCGFCRIHECH
ncbi:hypothetical protein MAH48_15145, partial [Anoxybacillus flavithermus]|nr:hypothetical protein [Anoxybacillus flavithermus]